MMILEQDTATQNLKINPKAPSLRIYDNDKIRYKMYFSVELAILARTIQEGAIPFNDCQTAQSQPPALFTTQKG